MRIDVFFDSICPWSYVAIRRLEVALDQSPQGNLHVNWSPFLLNPQMPAGGAGRQNYLRSKFGALERVNRMLDRLVHMGRELGIEFDFEAIKRTPNTIDAHRLIRFADQEYLGRDAVMALFKAFFEKGLDTGDPEVLLSIGRKLELDLAALENYLATPMDIDKILEQFGWARRLGIKSVPSFIFAGRFSISGAQEPAIFARMFEVAQEGRQDLLRAEKEPV